LGLVGFYFEKDIACREGITCQKDVSILKILQHPHLFQFIFLPSLTFQLAIFPSVIVGDIAGIVKFWATSVLALLWKPTAQCQNDD